VCMCVHQCVCVCVSMSVCVYVCSSVCVYVCPLVCVCKYVQRRFYISELCCRTFLCVGAMYNNVLICPSYVHECVCVYVSP